MDPAHAPRSASIRPKYYDLNVARLPPPGLVSILHRISGFALFFPILPALLYLLGASLASEAEFARWKGFFSHPVMKLALVGGAWLYAHHFFAGIRFLLLDVHIGIMKEPARASAWAVLALGAISALLFAWCIW
jgi:succinate dehydrogenase / fumarate reductase, cytochrome b subunit